MKAPAGLRLRAVGFNCGVYDTQNSKNDFKDMLPVEGADEARRLLDIRGNITSDHPPCFIMTSNMDFLVNEPKFLFDVLEKNNVPYEYKLYGNSKNKLGHVFHCDIKTESARTANLDELAFFRRYI